MLFKSDLYFFDSFLSEPKVNSYLLTRKQLSLSTNSNMNLKWNSSTLNKTRLGVNRVICWVQKLNRYSIQGYQLKVNMDTLQMTFIILPINYEKTPNNQLYHLTTFYMIHILQFDIEIVLLHVYLLYLKTWKLPITFNYQLLTLNIKLIKINS